LQVNKRLYYFLWADKKLNYFLQVNWELNCFLWANWKLSYFFQVNERLSYFFQVNWKMSYFFQVNEKLNRLIASSWVLKFESSTRLEKCRVELKFFWKSVELSWEVELKHASRIEKLDSITRLENSTQFNKILDKCK